ncbi:MAG: hypothetical protein ACKVII_04070 [Planctomycetales bacterium]
MVEDFVSVIFEEVIKAAFSGAFRQARSRKARVLKISAWACAAGSLILFLAAATIANGNAVIPAAVGGAASIAGFFGFGVWAAFVNAKCDYKEKP